MNSGRRMFVEEGLEEQCRHRSGFRGGSTAPCLHWISVVLDQPSLGCWPYREGRPTSRTEKREGIAGLSAWTAEPGWAVVSPRAALALANRLRSQVRQGSLH